MSLNAVVYANIKNLTIEEYLLDIDKDTGKVFFIDENNDFSEQDFIAISRRLGNLETVNYLYQKISEVLSVRESVILQKILYSGSHSGDKIDLTEIDRLELEIKLIREKFNSEDSCVLNFTDSLSKLCLVSIKERNPIIFV